MITFEDVITTGIVNTDYGVFKKLGENDCSILFEFAYNSAKLEFNDLYNIFMRYNKCDKTLSLINYNSKINPLYINEDFEFKNENEFIEKIRTSLLNEYEAMIIQKELIDKLYNEYMNNKLTIDDVIEKMNILDIMVTVKPPIDSNNISNIVLITATGGPHIKIEIDAVSTYMIKVYWWNNYIEGTFRNEMMVELFNHISETLLL